MEQKPEVLMKPGNCTSDMRRMNVQSLTEHEKYIAKRAAEVSQVLPVLSLLYYVGLLKPVFFLTAVFSGLIW